MEDVTEKQCIFEDHKVTQKNMSNFSTMRFSALGAGLTLMAILISVSKNASPMFQITYYLLLPLLSGATIRMVGSINRGMYIFSAHSSWLMRQLGFAGYSVVWPYYVEIAPKDSGAYAFIVASRFVNCLSFIFVFLNTLYSIFADTTDSFLKSANVFTLLYSTVFYITNEIYISRNMNPKNIVGEIDKNLEIARNKAIQAMIKNQDSSS